jgi:hypothetical protein
VTSDAIQHSVESHAHSARDREADLDADGDDEAEYRLGRGCAKVC